MQQVQDGAQNQGCWATKRPKGITNGANMKHKHLSEKPDPVWLLPFIPTKEAPQRLKVMRSLQPPNFSSEYPDGHQTLRDLHQRMFVSHPQKPTSL